VVHKIHTSSVGKTHFPSAWQRPQLRNWLLLNGSVASALVLILAIHANVLLSAGIDPGCCPGVMVDEVSASFRCMALFPSRWKLTSACSGGSRRHHGNGIGIDSGGSAAGATTSSRGCDTGRWCTRLVAIRQVRRTGTCAIFGQHSALVGPTFQLHVGFTLSALSRLAVIGRRSRPRGGARIVVDVVCPSQIILPTFPARR